MGRGVILLGHGAEASLLEYGVPVLTSWQAADRVDNSHPLYFGRPGIWGQRLANLVLDRADAVYNVGCRLSVWTVGYDFDRSKLVEDVPKANPAWLEQCNKWRAQFPWVESPLHDDPPGGIHPWRFVDALHEHLRPDEIIVTDMGTALVAAHQVLRLKPPQRLMTSGGLGEMGMALPAAIGASFARNKGEVLCLHCDGGMMFNLQELATIQHHKLPIKIIVFENQGYTMIRQTQTGAGYRLSGVDSKHITLPDFRRLAHAWGFAATDVYTWEHFRRAIPALFEAKEPALVVYHFPPEVDLLPKLLPVRTEGRVESPEFWDMSPCVSRS
jgi:acetolactate synthase-1/2/3 large subunit